MTLDLCHLQGQTAEQIKGQIHQGIMSCINTVHLHSFKWAFNRVVKKGVKYVKMVYWPFCLWDVPALNDARFIYHLGLDQYYDSLQVHLIWGIVEAGEVKWNKVFNSLYFTSLHFTYYNHYDSLQVHFIWGIVQAGPDFAIFC